MTLIVEKPKDKAWYQQFNKTKKKQKGWAVK